MPEINPFIGYEIHPVSEDENGTCWPCDSFEDAESNGVKAFWSLYGRLPNGGVDCIGDYEEYDHAAGMYAQISGLAAPAEAGSYVGLAAGIPTVVIDVLGGVVNIIGATGRARLVVIENDTPNEDGGPTVDNYDLGFDLLSIREACEACTEHGSGFDGQTPEAA